MVRRMKTSISIDTKHKKLLETYCNAENRTKSNMIEQMIYTYHEVMNKRL